MALLAVAAVFTSALVVSAITGQPANTALPIRLVILATLGLCIMLHQNWARWILVIQCGVWTAEQTMWALRGNGFGAVASPALLVCTIVLASGSVSQFMEYDP